MQKSARNLTPNCQQSAIRARKYIWMATHDGFCANPGCKRAFLDPLHGFISYRRTYISRRNAREPNTVVLDIKHRLEEVLNSRGIRGGAFPSINQTSNVKTLM